MRAKDLMKNLKEVNQWNHDTIGAISVDAEKHVASAVSTNGMTYKIPGRVPDSPIPGSGGWAAGRLGEGLIKVVLRNDYGNLKAT